jgi:hypothetical protein
MQDGQSYLLMSIAGGMASVGYGAFSGCSSLTSVFFIGNAPATNSFEFGSGAHETIYYLPGTIGWSSPYAGRPAVLWLPYSGTTNGGTITLTGYSGPNGGALILPGTLNGLPITSINSGAFAGFSDLTCITIPAGVTSLGSQAFYNCPGLTNIYFAGNEPAADASVFNGDANITVYYLPGTTGWSNTFDGLVALPWNPQIQTSAGGPGSQNQPFGFNLTGTTNITCVIEACTNLTNPGWTLLQTVTFTNGSYYFSDPKSTNYRVRYYQLRSP